MKQLCDLMKRHTPALCCLLAALLVLSLVGAMGLGPVSIPFPQVWQVVLGRLAGLLTGREFLLEVRLSTQNIVWFLRAPRVLLGLSLIHI